MPATLQRELDAHGAQLPGSSDTLRLRHAALDELAAAGLPTPRRENWRYTDLKPVADAAFEVVPRAPSSRSAAAAATLLAAHGLPPTAQRLVFIDGAPAPELGAVGHAPGYEAGELAAHWSRFEARYPARIVTAEHPLATLNRAFARHGAWVSVPAGVRVSTPLHLVFVAAGESGLAPQPRVVIELGPRAELTVVQHFLDAGDPAGWLNSVTQVDQAADSRLTLYRLQQHGPQQTHTALVSADLGARAAFKVGLVDLGGRLIRNDVDVRLRGPGAATELFGVFLAGAAQHVDDHLRIDHLVPDTRSDAAFRGIIGSRGRGVFNGKVVVHRDAQRTDAHQSNDNLLLGEHAEIDTKPELEIYADDVKCSHGSTVGELDPEQLFYLRARSLDEPAARELLTAAFAASVLERLGDGGLREEIQARVAARLRAMTGRTS